VHEQCKDITAVKTMVSDIKEDVKGLKGLYTSVNIIKGGLVIIGIMVGLFLFIVGDTRSQVAALSKRQADDIREIRTIVNEDLKALAVSNMELKTKLEAISEQVGIINQNILWTIEQEYLGKKPKEK
jgi:hypothetical protein